MQDILARMRDDPFEGRRREMSVEELVFLHKKVGAGEVRRRMALLDGLGDMDVCAWANAHCTVLHCLWAGFLAQYKCCPEYEAALKTLTARTGEIVDALLADRADYREFLATITWSEGSEEGEGWPNSKTSARRAW